MKTEKLKIKTIEFSTNIANDQWQKFRMDKEHFIISIHTRDLGAVNEQKHVLGAKDLNSMPYHEALGFRTPTRKERWVYLQRSFMHVDFEKYILQNMVQPGFRYIYEGVVNPNLNYIVTYYEL